MGLGTLLRRQEVRDIGNDELGWADYLNLYSRFGFGGTQYMVGAGALSQITAIQSLKNPIVLAAMILRGAAFSEARLQFQSLGSGNAGRPARNLFGTSALQILEHPWPGASTGDLLAKMEMDATLYGNSYWYPNNGTLTWIDPNKMKILSGDVPGPSGAVVGAGLLAYQTQNRAGQPEETFLPKEIIHYRPIPDPDNPFRGLSWLSSLLNEVSQDSDITDFKRAFLRNSATPSLVIGTPAGISQDAFNAFRDKVESSHTGAQSAFKVLYVSQGADVKTVGSNWSDMELFATQSYGDTRLAVASGVPASLLGIAEGLKGSALNAGNYTATRRRFADLTIRPLWARACTALETAITVPAGSRLWVDDRDIMFLQADMQDAAAVRTADAASLASLVTAGFTRDSAVIAVTTNDFSALEEDPDAISIQLQPPQPAPAPLGLPAPQPDDNEDDDEPDS